MTNQHPITLPPELVTQRWDKPGFGGDFAQEFATFFARWGADQELEACCEWLDERAVLNGSTALRTARRPKPPSLKEQALALLQPGEPRLFNNEMQDTIRRALETLDD